VINIEILIGLGIGLVLFLCTIKAYTLGIKHGKQLISNSVPDVNLNPVKSFKQYVQDKETKKEDDLITEGLNNIFSYTGDPQVKEGD